MELKKDYKLLMVIGTLLVISLVIGTSYAYWTITHTQAKKNVASTSCFTTTFTESNDISLTNQFPIIDSDGKKLTPYTFTIKNTCSIAANYQINLEVLNTTTADLTYIKTEINNDTPLILNTYSTVDKTIDTATSSYKMHEGYLGASASVTYNLRLWIDENAPLAIMQNKLFNAKVVVVTSATATKNFADTLLNDAGGTTAIATKAEPDFSKAAVSQEYYNALSDKTNYVVENGIWSATDDYGTSYYYRGAVTNNNMLFGGFCWKVIRINGNGTTRILYNGTPTDGKCSATGTSAQIGTSKFNSSQADNAYLGYMYGTPGSSTIGETVAHTNSSIIKTYIDNWYNTNLTSVASKISDTAFCDDLSRASTANTWMTDDTTLGYGANYTYYGAYNRVNNEHTPVLTCPNSFLNYTVDDTTTGNGDLTYPVGLLTADEMAMAGGLFLTVNNSFYLYSTSDYWAISPDFLNPTGAVNYAFNTSNSAGGCNIDSACGVRPVINLITNIHITSGDGTINNPYVIE